jgi:hypothetical protein
MDRNIVYKYIQLCKKYNYDQICNNLVNDKDEINTIQKIKNYGKLEYIYDTYHEMKGGKGGKGKSKPKKKNHNSDGSNEKSNILKTGLEVAGATIVGTGLYNSMSQKSNLSTQVPQQSQPTLLNTKEQVNAIKLEIMDTIETQLTDVNSKLSILLDKRVNDIIAKQK